MNNPKTINEQSIREAGKSSLNRRRNWQPALHTLLAMTAIVVFAGCSDHGHSGGSYGSHDPYYSRGYNSGGVHRGYGYGIQHGIGRSGFGHGGGRGH